MQLTAVTLVLAHWAAIGMELRHLESSADRYGNDGAPDSTLAGEVMPNGVGVGLAKLQTDGNVPVPSAKGRLLGHDEIVESFEKRFVNGDGFVCGFGSGVT